MKFLKFKEKILFVLMLFILISLFFPISGESDSAFGPPITTERYEISRSKIERTIAEKHIIQDQIILKNKRDSRMSVSFSVIGDVQNLIRLSSDGIMIDPQEQEKLNFEISGVNIGRYQGRLYLRGDISEEIPITINVVNETKETKFIIDIVSPEKTYYITENLTFLIDIRKLTSDLTNETINISYNFVGDEFDYLLKNETLRIPFSTQIKKTFQIPENVTEGIYNVELKASTDDFTIVTMSEFEIIIPFWLIEIFGIPLWILFISILFLILVFSGFFIARKIIEKKKRYKMNLDFKKIPKKGERTFYLGKIAETNVDTYYNMDDLTTHMVVAGATGGGKSISAQVFIEEALKNDIAVVVFDPTAQWSGMLRKCEDKGMLAHYSKFGLKPTDAKAFPGTVKPVKNSRQAIDITKYMEPGKINIFSLNKLDPSEMDVFVSSAIISIFRSGPDEHPGLRTIFVFDEVHRLLPKFGGSGKGFLQIERACREFRKWGFGILLVSQVLSDFVGEIKANINTEVQMRTRDESDLERIKTKYGEKFLQSLIKASVGAGMFVNPKYNGGTPYFVQFRPILHNTRRLSDEELDKYHKYGEIVEDLEYQIEQFKDEKVDVFDLNMELKLVKDKLMTGNFNVVDIYLEGLKPRIEKEWEKLGKKPKKKEIELIEEEEVEKSLKEAEKERKKWDKGKSETKTKETKKEKISEKIVKPLTFENGMMISSLKELEETLPSVSQDILNSHITEDKNDISDWISNEIDSGLGNKLSELNTKEEILKAVRTFRENEGKKEDRSKDEKSQKEIKEKEEETSKDKQED